MQSNKYSRIVALLIVALGVTLGGCKDGGAPEPSASTGAAAAKGPPTGAYESRMPDGTAIRLDFRGGGAVGMAMTEGGETNSFDGRWVQNGEAILVEGDEGLNLELRWRGDELVSDTFGLTMTFTKR